MNDGRFAIATHILTLLSRSDGHWVSSEFIAGSVNINPVLVRRETASLRRAGIVACKEGKNGGYLLAREPDLILLSDVYRALYHGPLLAFAKNRPNPACEVGRQIEGHLAALYGEAEQALLDVLGRTTLKAFVDRFD